MSVSAQTVAPNGVGGGGYPDLSCKQAAAVGLPVLGLGSFLEVEAAEPGAGAAQSADHRAAISIQFGLIGVSSHPSGRSGGDDAPRRAQFRAHGARMPAGHVSPVVRPELRAGLVPACPFRWVL